MPRLGEMLLFPKSFSASSSAFLAVAGACAFLRKLIIRKLAQSKRKKLRKNPLFFLQQAANAGT
jgi:hypothetical protein